MAKEKIQTNKQFCGYIIRESILLTSKKEESKQVMIATKYYQPDQDETRIRIEPNH
jgi:hypothetical protein